MGWIGILWLTVDGVKTLLDETETFAEKADAVEATVEWGDLLPGMSIEYRRVVA